MARYPIKQLKDKNENPFFPFNTLESVLVDGTDQNLADVLNNIYTKAEVNTMFATELSKFSVYPTQADLPSTAREGAVAATNENNVYLMYMYYSGAWRALTQKGDKGDTGAVGPTGPTGPTGPAGRDGAIQYTAGEGIDITNNTISVTNGAKAITQDTNIKDLDPGVYICNGDYKLYWSSDAYVKPKGILEVASHNTSTSRNFSIITKSFSYQTSSSSGGSLYPHLFVGEAPSNITPTIKRLDTLASDDVATAYNKGLMSSTDKAKLNGISAGAEVNVQSDWNESDNTSDSYIQNKPTVPTKVSDLDNDSGFIDNTVNDLTNYTLATDTGHSIDLSINTTTYIMTLALKNSAGTTISTDTVDLPLESVVVNGTYDSTNKKIVLTLQSGSTIDIPVGDLVSGLQTEITSNNKLSADLVDDTSTTNKFVTASDKTTWSGKQDALVSGTNIKTINGDSVLGNGNIEVASIGQLVATDYNTEAKALVLETLKPGVYYVYNGSTPTFYMKALSTSTGTRSISVNSSSQKFVLVITKTPTSTMSTNDHIGVLLTNKWGSNGSRWGGYIYTLQYNTTSSYGNLNVNEEVSGDSNLVTTSGIQTISGKKAFSTLPESSVVPTTDTQLVNKKYVDDSIVSPTDVQINGTSIVSSSTANIVTETAYDSTNNKIATMSDTELVMLTYGTSTWQDFIDAFNSNKIVYCYVNGRCAFMAYKSNLNVEFQYYRSVSSPTASSQVDEVFVYKLTNANVWTTTTRKASTSIATGTGINSSYDATTRTMTLSADTTTMATKQYVDTAIGAALNSSY